MLKALVRLFQTFPGSAVYAVGCAAYAVGCAAYAVGCAAYAAGCAAYEVGCAAYAATRNNKKLKKCHIQNLICLKKIL